MRANGRRARAIAFLAIAAILAAGAAAAVLTADDGPAAAQPVATADPATAFAPLVRLHSRERHFPIGAADFISWSNVSWDGGPYCFDPSLAIGRKRFATRRDEENVPFVDARKLGDGRSPYRFRSRTRYCRNDPRSPLYAANQHTRPHDDTNDRPAGLPVDQGFYLDVMTRKYGGNDELERRGPQRLVSGTPAYVDQRPERVDGEPGLRIDYWFLYAATKPPGDKPFIASSEGGWERIGVLLRRDGKRRFVPESVRYHVRNRHEDRSWSEVDRVDAAARPGDEGTHPVVYAARGSHASYAEPGRYDYVVRGEGERLTLHDDAQACAECPQWRTWERLQNVREQPWYGYGGGWGLVWQRSETSGPLGPSPYRR